MRMFSNTSAESQQSMQFVLKKLYCYILRRTILFWDTTVSQQIQTSFSDFIVLVTGSYGRISVYYRQFPTFGDAVVCCIVSSVWFPVWLHLTCCKVVAFAMVGWLPSVNDPRLRGFIRKQVTITVIHLPLQYYFFIVNSFLCRMTEFCSGHFQTVLLYWHFKRGMH